MYNRTLSILVGSHLKFLYLMELIYYFKLISTTSTEFYWIFWFFSSTITTKKIFIIFFFWTVISFWLFYLTCYWIKYFFDWFFTPYTSKKSCNCGIIYRVFNWPIFFDKNFLTFFYFIFIIIISFFHNKFNFNSD